MSGVYVKEWVVHDGELVQIVCYGENHETVSTKVKEQQERIEKRKMVQVKHYFVEVFVYLHNCSFVSTSVAVVWRREECGAFPFMRLVEAICDELMRTNELSEAIRRKKSLCSITTERITCTTWTMKREER